MVETPDRGMAAAGAVHTYDADVVIVGAGPAGATCATHLARRGLDVLLLEKTTFPREKICGDGLTPRAVKQLVKLGVDTSQSAGWLHNFGLRIYGGHQQPFDLKWPELKDFPNYGLTRGRSDFDKMLADLAVASGVRLREETNVTAPIINERNGRITGVVTKDGYTFRAPVVVAADGNSSRLALAMGLQRNEKRPMGVAVRAYYESPRHTIDHLESWLELWEGEPGKSRLLPGYGWIFGMGDGTCNVGLGILNTSSAFGKTDYKQLLRRWLNGTPEEWGFREKNRTCEIRGAALPMGFNRQPAYTKGLVLVGDSGGMVNPFNGEGIAYAMESGEMAAQAIADAHSRGIGSSNAELALRGYPVHLRAEWGAYFSMGSLFVKMIGNPQIMRVLTTYGLPRKTLMQFTMRMLANLHDKQGGDAMDKLINLMEKVAPKA